MKPLTVEELRELELDDWVWVDCSSPRLKRYFQKDLDCEDSFMATGIYSFPYSEYGTRWIAYKNKEEVEAKGEILELPCLVEHKLGFDDNPIYQKELIYRTKNGYIATTIYNEDEFAEAERRFAELKGE